MSKALRHIPKPERVQVIKRRLGEKKGGLGYLSALEAAKHEGIK